MTALATHDRERLTRWGLRLAIFTIVYNLAEGAIAIAAGIGAGLVSLIGFGIDSGIESASAVLVAIRLASRLRTGEIDERREKFALRGIALTFFALAAYVIVDGIRSLVIGERPDVSIVGMVVLAASIVVMPVLAAAKTRVGRRLEDRLILADAAETRICVLLSISTLVGLIAFALTGAAWLDAVAGFVIAVFAIKEGIEAWGGELVHDHDHSDDDHH